MTLAVRLCGPTADPQLARPRSRRAVVGPYPRPTRNRHPRAQYCMHVEGRPSARALLLPPAHRPENLFKPGSPASSRAALPSRPSARSHAHTPGPRRVHPRVRTGRLGRPLGLGRPDSDPHPAPHAHLEPLQLSVLGSPVKGPRAPPNRFSRVMRAERLSPLRIPHLGWWGRKRSFSLAMSPFSVGPGSARRLTDARRALVAAAAAVEAGVGLGPPAPLRGERGEVTVEPLSEALMTPIPPPTPAPAPPPAPGPALHCPSAAPGRPGKRSARSALPARCWAR